jgi:homoserine dehydrogenase
MKKLRIGLAGLGCVGRGVYDILKKDAKLLAARAGMEMTIVAAASRTKKDFLDSNIRFYENILDLANDPEIDVIVEVIGGKGIAKDLVCAAIKNGKKVVTANKALLAEDGFELAKLVEENNGHIGFEAAVAASTQIVKSFKESFTANEIKEFYGILNGTCNFILSKMLDEKKTYAQALSEAQEAGYAEADPSFDIKGIDSLHKLVLLSAIALNSKSQFSQTYVEGIEAIDLEDLELAFELGYKIKLLGIFKKDSSGHIQSAVYPAVVKKSEKISQVEGSYNAILTSGSNFDFNLVIGRGAGSLPTGSAIVADLVEVARGVKSDLFAVKVSQLQDVEICKISNRVGKYFLRLVIDKELAKQGDLAEKLFAGRIKIEQAHLINKEEEILAAFIISETKEKDLVEILSNLDESLVKSAKFLRVEETNF